MAPHVADVSEVVVPTYIVSIILRLIGVEPFIIQYSLSPIVPEIIDMTRIVALAALAEVVTT